MPGIRAQIFFLACFSTISFVHRFGETASAVQPEEQKPATFWQVSESPRTDSFQRPTVIQFHATVAKMQSALKDLCVTMRTRRIVPPFLEHVKSEQVQIDCDGFRFEGGLRHAEFVFRDDLLEMVWIMCSAQEDSMLKERMTKTYGVPRKRGARYLQYAAARVALRLDKHEVLFYSLSIAPEVETWFLDADEHN